MGEAGRRRRRHSKTNDASVALHGGRYFVLCHRPWQGRLCYLVVQLVSVIQNQMASSRSSSWYSLEHGVIEGPCFEKRVGEVNLNCVQDVCGVKEQPLFDAIDTDHFVPPTLHLTVDKGNDVLENLTRELVFGQLLWNRKECNTCNFESRESQRRISIV